MENTVTSRNGDGKHGRKDHTSINTRIDSCSQRLQAREDQPVSDFITNSRYSFVVKTEATIQMTKLIEILRKRIPQHCFISRRGLSLKRSVALFKISAPNQETERKAVEALRTPETEASATESYGAQLRISPFDQSYRRKIEEEKLKKHAVARYVPINYTNDLIMEELGMSDMNSNVRVRSCHRILTGDDGHPTQSVRIVCEDAQSADVLMKNGLRLKGLKFTCERAHQQHTVQRCYRCQSKGHQRRFCKKPVKCGKCTGPHETDGCTFGQDQYRCCSCDGPHAVWYAGCVYNRLEVSAAREKDIFNRRRQNIERAEQDPPRKTWPPTTVEKLTAPVSETAPEKSPAHPTTVTTVSAVNVNTDINETRIGDMIYSVKQELKEMRNEMLTRLQEFSELILKNQNLTAQLDKIREDITINIRNEISEIQQIPSRTSGLFKSSKALAPYLLPSRVSQSSFISYSDPAAHNTQRNVNGL